MKAEMDESGTITLTPETSVEAYAMRHWVRQNIVQMHSHELMESCFVRGSSLLVNHEVQTPCTVANSAEHCDNRDG